MTRRTFKHAFAFFIAFQICALIWGLAS